MVRSKAKYWGQEVISDGEPVTILEKNALGKLVGTLGEYRDLIRRAKSESSKHITEAG